MQESQRNYHGLESDLVSLLLCPDADDTLLFVIQWTG